MLHDLSHQVLIAATMSNGQVTIMTFMTAGQSPALPYGAEWVDPQHPGIWKRAPTDANIFAELSKAFPSKNRLGVPRPTVVSYKIIDRSELPSDRTYRNAWRHDKEKGFTHDMAHARQLHLEKVRNARLRKLGELDREWTKLIGQGKTIEADAIEAERQRLRDMPQTLPVEQAQTVEELKAMWPEGLN